MKFLTDCVWEFHGQISDNRCVKWEETSAAFLAWWTWDMGDYREDMGLHITWDLRQKWDCK